MNAQAHTCAEDFLRLTIETLERDEPVTSMILANCLALQRTPPTTSSPPFLATVGEGDPLVAGAALNPAFPLTLCAFDGASDAAWESLANLLLREKWPVRSVLAPNEVATAFAHAWKQLTGNAYTTAHRLRIYELRRVIPPRPAPGQLRIARADDVDVIVEWSATFEQEALHRSADIDVLRQKIAQNVAQRDMALWCEADGTPASMVARSRKTHRGIFINRVYTPPPLRGKGYASSCVAQWSQRQLDEGLAFCTLFTDLENPTSNHIYQEIGYTPVRDFFELEFAQDTN